MITRPYLPIAKVLFGLMLVGTLGCSSDPTASAASDTAAASPSVTPAGTATSATTSTGASAATATRSQGSSTMQRVIITLNPVSSDQPDIEASQQAVDEATQYLATNFPEATVVRTMPGFGQMVIELPADQLKALSADPMVASATLDARHRTMPIDPGLQTK